MGIFRWPRAQHELQIAEALDKGRSVYLSICSSAAELYTLPWELLTQPRWKADRHRRHGQDGLRLDRCERGVATRSPRAAL